MPKRYRKLRGDTAYYPFAARTGLRARQRRHVRVLRGAGLAALALAAVLLVRQTFFRGGQPDAPAAVPTAPAVTALPAPTHVFLGGTSGNLRDILDVILNKNPEARIVATAVTLESLSQLTAALPDFRETEVVSVSVARDRKLGAYHLMTGQNPIYIVTMQGRKET